MADATVTDWITTGAAASSAFVAVAALAIAWRAERWAKATVDAMRRDTDLGHRPYVTAVFGDDGSVRLDNNGAGTATRAAAIEEGDPWRLLGPLTLAPATEGQWDFSQPLQKERLSGLPHTLGFDVSRNRAVVLYEDVVGTRYSWWAATGWLEIWHPKNGEQDPEWAPLWGIAFGQHDGRTGTPPRKGWSSDEM